MKTLITLITYTVLFLSSAYGQGRDISKIENALRTRIDSSWTIEMDTTNIDKNAFLNGVSLGWAILTNNKGDKLTLRLCKSVNDHLLKLKAEIKETQIIASCELSQTEHFRSILRIENYFMYLPTYPCWSSYTKNSQLLFKELVEKTTQL